MAHFKCTEYHALHASNTERLKSASQAYFRSHVIIWWGHEGLNLSLLEFLQRCKHRVSYVWANFQVHHILNHKFNYTLPAVFPSISLPLQLLRWPSMKIVTLLLKVKAKSVSLYELTDSSLFLCGLLLKSVMEQLLVGCGNDISLSICTCHPCNTRIGINRYDNCLTFSTHCNGLLTCCMGMCCITIFFIPVWAVVEINDGTATGGLCMSLGIYI